jgi:coenzyme PQQ precursor peptide PqqA
VIKIGAARNNPRENRFHGRFAKQAGRPPTLTEEINMAWTTPMIVEVCVGMEITSYSSAEI